jgi:hypothetical protein
MISKTEIHKRRIGSVVIFDLFGDLTDGEIDMIKDFIERNIQRGGHRNVILNVQNVKHVDQLALRKMLVPLERPHRKAIFSASNEILEAFFDTYLPEKMVVCRNEAEISDTFGIYLLEKDKFIFKGERRKSRRIEVALPVTFNVQTPAGNVSTRALITNLSEGGLFAEYLDLAGALEIRNLRDIRNLPVTAVFRSPLASEDQTFGVEVLRVEVTSRQTGVALRLSNK